MCASNKLFAEKDGHSCCFQCQVLDPGAYSQTEIVTLKMYSSKPTQNNLHD